MENREKVLELLSSIKEQTSIIESALDKVNDLVMNYKNAGGSNLSYDFNEYQSTEKVIENIIIRVAWTLDKLEGNEIIRTNRGYKQSRVYKHRKAIGYTMP